MVELQNIGRAGILDGSGHLRVGGKFGEVLADEGTCLGLGAQVDVAVVGVQPV